MHQAPGGILYLVPTPIGNLEDITIRAINVLKTVDLIAAEDTRVSLKLLRHYEISPPRLVSLHKYNQLQKSESLISELALGRKIAIISDAGSPGISDPSQIVVRMAIEKGIKVEALPGATAFVPALTASGLDSSSFVFIGFLPSKSKDKKNLLERLATSPQTIILYEAPHRLRKTLDELYKYLGSRKVVIAREISKLYEEYIRGDLESVIRDYPITEKGEFVVLLEGASPQKSDENEILSEIIRMQEGGHNNAEILATLSVRHPRNLVYQLILDQKKK